MDNYIKLLDSRIKTITDKTVNALDLFLKNP